MPSSFRTIVHFGQSFNFIRRPLGRVTGLNLFAYFLMLGAIGAIDVCGNSGAVAQTPGSSSAPALVTTAVSDDNRVALSGNRRPEANAANDRGAVADSYPMDHMLLHLRRSPGQEAILQDYIKQLHDPASPNFHKWLSPEDYGARFGLAGSDIESTRTWLAQKGFSIDLVYPNGTLIGFSGTAGQVRAAFRTEIHRLNVNGADHIANMSDPQIPAALAPVVAGVTALNDFKPRPQVQPRTEYTVTATRKLMVPADLATIYNLNPLFARGIDGTGQTIYLIEDSNYYTANDWVKFRATFGLSQYTGASLSLVHPQIQGGTNCVDPGYNDDDGEVILDTQWASASAPNAAIVVAACTDLILAIQNVINAPNPPAIMSISYGQCETAYGPDNAAINVAYQQAVAQGISVYVSSGDSGAALCDGGSVSGLGINVNSLAATQYNVAVGGTDFSDLADNTESTYWSATNTSTFGSALSYVPEIPWNSSCASSVLTQYKLGAGAVPYGSSGFCNTQTSFRTIVGGSGGPSLCFSGTPAHPYISTNATSATSGGTCVGYPKPSWQTGVVGIPNDGVRGLPDVALFAASGLWGHFYVLCLSDTTLDSSSQPRGKGCAGDPSTWDGAGGTSFAAPIVAGMQALVNQYNGARQGNPNIVLYKLAATEYGQSGSTSCNSSSGNAVSTSCVFYDVTRGDMSVPCVFNNNSGYNLLVNCYRPSGTYGVLSTDNNSYQPAYGTKVGWDFATGLGTINANNLVTQWNSATGAVLPALQVTPSSNIVATGNQSGPFSPASFSYQLSSTSGQINYTISGVPAWLTPSSTSGSVGTTPTTVSFTINASANALAAGPYNATITFTNGANGLGTTTRTATLTVLPPALQVAETTNITATGNQGGPFSPATFTYTLTSNTGSVGYTITGVPSWLDVSSASGTASASPTSVTFTVNASAASLPVGTQEATISFVSGDGSGTTTRTATIIVNGTAGQGNTTIFSSILPDARTTTVGNVVTAFATIINAGAVNASGCFIAPPTSFAGGFLYQTTDASNIPTGTPNTAVDIGPGQAKSFYFAVTPSQVGTQDIALIFGCTNAQPPASVSGLNTFLLSTSPAPIPDMLSISATLSNDGNLVVAGPNGLGVMVTAAIDIGAAGSVTFTPTDTPAGQSPRNLPVTLTVCPSNASAVCTSPPAPSFTTSVTPNQVLTFNVYTQGQGTLVSYNPAQNRIFLLATQGATPVGETSAALKMTASPDQSADLPRKFGALQ